MSRAPYDQYFWLKESQRFHTSRYPTGRLIFQDSFEDTQLHWTCSSMYSGAGGDCQIISGGFNTNSAYRLSTGSVGSGGYELYRRMGRLPWPSMRLGIEFWFHINNNNVASAPWAHRFHFGIEIVGGKTNPYKDIAAICMDDTGQLFYNSTQSALMGGVNFGSLLYMAGIQYVYWNHVKLVADFRNGLDTGQYVSLKMNDQDYSSILAGINTDWTETSGETDPFNNMETWFIANNSPSTSGGSANLEFRIDDFIFTCEEP